jgi:hypothetical protein
MRADEALGRAIGGLLAPVTGEGSLIRRARLFHPDGVVYRAEVRPLVRTGAVGELAQRLAGPAIVRLSGGWWRNERELPDVLGVAIRLRTEDDLSAEPGPRDQDLTFATFRHMWSLPLAPLGTNVHDYLANDYYAVLPYYALGLGRIKLRLIPPQVKTVGEDRRERLERAVAADLAVLRLEMRRARVGAPWEQVAAIDLRERALVDQDKLAFSPFRSGRGLEPVGLFQMVRAATYASSRTGRQVAA